MKNHNEQGLMQYDTIKSATKGDPDAVAAVLRHYEKYIAHLAVQKEFDQYGNSQWIVNNEIREQLQEKLIIAILSFEV